MSPVVSSTARPSDGERPVRGLLLLLESFGIVADVDGVPPRGVVYERVSETAKALTNGRRLELLELLAQRERPVEALSRLVGSTMSTTSANLQVLRRAGLVGTRREGTTIFYFLSGDDVASLVVALKSVSLRHSAAVRDLWHDLSEGVAVSSRREVVAQREGQDAWFVLDVRPAEEFAAGHFPGAVSIPLDDLEARVDEVPRDRRVTVYCRGEFCTLAREAAAYLRGCGVEASAMDEGVLEWRGGYGVLLDDSA